MTDLLIPGEVVDYLREILARALDRSDGVTDEDRQIARLRLVGAMDHVLGPSMYRAPETRAGDAR